MLMVETKRKVDAKEHERLLQEERLRRADHRRRAEGQSVGQLFHFFLFTFSCCNHICKYLKWHSSMNQSHLTDLDSTMMSPVLMKPISLGADIVVHSATKFFGGHADAMGGFVCVGDAACLDCTAPRWQRSELGALVLSSGCLGDGEGVLRAVGLSLRVLA